MEGGWLVGLVGGGGRRWTGVLGLWDSFTRGWIDRPGRGELSVSVLLPTKIDSAARFGGVRNEWMNGI